MGIAKVSLGEKQILTPNTSVDFPAQNHFSPPESTYPDDETTGNGSETADEPGREHKKRNGAKGKEAAKDAPSWAKAASKGP